VVGERADWDGTSRFSNDQTAPARRANQGLGEISARLVRDTFSRVLMSEDNWMDRILNVSLPALIMLVVLMSRLHLNGVAAQR